MKSGMMNSDELRRGIIMMAIWGVVWLVIVVLAGARTMTLAWDPPESNLDGTPLTNEALFVVYARADTNTTWREVGRTLDWTPQLTVTVESNDTQVAVSAANTQGLEGPRSEPLDFLAVPVAPTGLRITHAGATATTGWFRAEFSKDWQDWQSVAWRVQYEEQAE